MSSRRRFSWPGLAFALGVAGRTNGREGAGGSMGRIVSGLGLLPSWVPLLTRVTIGLAFVQTGMGKWAHIDRTAEFFAGLGIPMPAANAVVVASLELVGGAALVAGVLTRFFALSLSTTMVVALLTADREAFVAAWSRASETSPTDVTSFVFLLFLLWLAFFGPGRLSLDHLLAGAYRRLARGAAAWADTGRGSAAKNEESSRHVDRGAAGVGPVGA